jgi:hypothetical protein
VQDPAFLIGKVSCGEESSVLSLLDRGAHHLDDVGMTGERTVDKGGSVGRQTRERHTREMVKGPCHAPSARARQIRSVWKNGEKHIGGVEDAVTVTVSGDKAKETVEALDGAERSNGLLAGEGTGGRQDAEVNETAIV